MNDLQSIGTKILVVGVSAAGKTTFSRKLADITGLPLILMDSIIWKPGWEWVDDDVIVKRLDEESAKPRWIIEGYITKEAGSFLFDRADTIIYLDYSPWAASWRYVRRWWKHRREPRPELEGSPEKFSFTFLKLIWTKGEAISLNKFLAKIEDQRKILTFLSPDAADDFLRKLD